MPQARFALPLGLILAGEAIAQTPPVAPAGMTLQQFLTMARGRFMDRDADGDGRISAAEFAAAAGMHHGGKGKKAAMPAADAPAPGDAPAADGAPMRGQMASRMFQRVDTNGDGYLDKAEIDAMLTRRFERMDTDHDGVVTAAEREAARGFMRGRMGAGQ